MKPTKLLNITRSHILRIILCSIATMTILLTVGVVNRVYMYIFAKWNIDLIQNNINTNLPIEVAIVVVIWNYVIGFVIILLLWKFVGFPKITLIEKVYKRFIDIYYVD